MSWAYVITATAMIAVPGPDVLLLSSRTLERGATPAVRTLAGTVAGYLLITVLVALGLGAALAASDRLLEVLRVAATAYLLWLALRAWRTAGTVSAGGGGSARGEFRDGFLTSALNPKGLLFFLALLPPFVDDDRPAGGQLLVLGLVFCLLASLVYSLVVLATVAARRRLDVTRPVVGRTTAVVLAGAAVLVGSGAVG